MNPFRIMLLASSRQWRILPRSLLWLTLGNSVAGAAEPSIDLTGVSGDLQENLRAGLSLTTEPCSAPEWRIKRLFRRADEELDRAARALGYYRIKLEKNLQFKQPCWQASFNIDPGEPTRLNQVTIRIEGDAQDDPAFIKLLKATPVRPGSQVHHGHYETLKGEIESLAAERGYFDGRFLRRELRVEPAANQASILLHYRSGPRYRIGTLELDQQTYEPELLERYLKIKAGDPYDSGAISSLHRALADSGFFERVSVKPDYEGAIDGKINVQVALEPIKRTAYRIGIGAATDTGPRLSLAYDRRRINRFGHRLQSKLTLSSVDSSLGIEYLIPMQEPHIDQLSIRTGYRELDTDTTTSDTATIGLRTLGMRGGWNETRYIDWVSEDSLIGDEDTSATLLVPGVSWARTTADHRMQPRQGSRLNLELRGAHESLFSDASFVQLLAAGKWIQPLGKGRLLLRADTGVTFASTFTELPASYRFFAGGDQSVRGYGYQSLGPQDTDGTVVGGRYLLSSSLEYEYPIQGAWSAALFVDAGNAFDGWNDGLKRSAGVGLRWRSPVGPIRLDLAIPNDRSQDSFRIHFSMGPDL
ncbi:autotransporter assembly complex protein TamA [Sedimenticola selenatireducens]|uniref:autotransporter assembly complex protein TamA n=1 Tax=Sedimenticola selenatireducens TaxID=191960 RepID=UPI0004B56FD1|nr:autotransporter assembly complex family protein [Sedimenticola selenatireducens]